jgi:hypothetical protein
MHGILSAGGSVLHFVNDFHSLEEMNEPACGWLAPASDELLVVRHEALRVACPMLAVGAAGGSVLFVDDLHSL